MKRFAVILSIITAISLCGCDVKEPQSTPDSSVNNSSESSATESYTESSTESSTENSEPEVNEPEEPEEPRPSIPMGIETVPTEDYIGFFDVYGVDFPPEELESHLDYYGVRAKGAYVYMPTKICRTSRDNADVFDSDNLKFSDTPTRRASEPFRVKEGDEVCGHTVKSAVSNYGVYDGGILSRLFSVSLELEGTAELTGYMSIQPEDEYGISAGDIKFIPSDCEIDLPVVDFNQQSFRGMCDDIVYFNEYGITHLGNANRMTVDLTGIPSDSSYVKVRVTVENIRLSFFNEILSLNGDITELTIL